MNHPKFGWAALTLASALAAAMGLMLAVGFGASESLVWLAVGLILVSFWLAFKLTK